jgi:hypothetical protein
LGAHRAYVEHFFATYKFHELYADRGLRGWAVQLGVLACTMGAAVAILGAQTAWRSRHERDARALARIILISFVYLFAMWIVRRSVGWRRHYLAIGCLMTPFAAIGLARLRRRTAIALVAADFLLVFATAAPFVYVPRRYAQAARFLRDHAGPVYCDEPGVRVMTGEWPERFVDGAPRGTADEVVAWLRARGVRWVVYGEVDYSPLSEVFPWMREAQSRPPFALAFDPPSNRSPLPRVYVYELRP